jgi:hypothetical protein
MSSSAPLDGLTGPEASGFVAAPLGGLTPAERGIAGVER